MKKIKLYLIIITLILAFLFAACGHDNPLLPTDYFDLPRFNWRTVDVYYRGFAGAWASDTSKIFLLNHYNRSLYIVSGGNVTTLSVGDYYLNEIKGISNNEVYLFGTKIGGNMTIIKWNGAGFEYYPTNIYVTGFNVNSVRGCAVNSNEIWICSQNGISKFDGVNMTNYSYEDILLSPFFLFLTNDNKVQYVAGREIDTAHYQESLFEFRDTGFVRIFNHMILPYITMGGTNLREVGGFKYGRMDNWNPYNNSSSICIEYFIDSSFIPYFCFNDKIKTSWSTIGPNLVGTNLQNFIFLAHTGHEYIFTDPLTKVPYPVGIVHWNGSKVSKEIGLWGWNSPYPYDSFILQNINSNSYLILCPYSLNMGNSTLFIGTKK